MGTYSKIYEHFDLEKLTKTDLERSSVYDTTVPANYHIYRQYIAEEDLRKPKWVQVRNARTRVFVQYLKNATIQKSAPNAELDELFHRLSKIVNAAAPRPSTEDPDPET